jgi:hypothetical protein
MGNLDKYLDYPPEFGSLSFELNINPVSHQGSGKGRGVVRQAMADAVSCVRYLLSGELAVEIEWRVQEKLRYEADSSPDVDNIVKPMLDGLCGPGGLLINDCQVQSAHCYWIDTAGEQSVNFTFRYSPDEWVPKDGLEFVNMGRKLYMPISRNIKKEFQVDMLEQWRKMFDLRDQIESQEVDPYLANMVMPLQRPFHRSRLEGFVLHEYEDLHKSLTT